MSIWFQYSTRHTMYAGDEREWTVVVRQTSLSFSAIDGISMQSTSCEKCVQYEEEMKKVELLTPWCGGFHKSNNIDASFLLYSAIKSLLIFISIRQCAMFARIDSQWYVHTRWIQIYSHFIRHTTMLRFESKTSRTTNDIDGQREITVINWNNKMFEFYICNIY